MLLGLKTETVMASEMSGILENLETDKVKKRGGGILSVSYTQFSKPYIVEIKVWLHSCLTLTPVGSERSVSLPAALPPSIGGWM